MSKLRAGRTHVALLESADRRGTNDFSFIALGARDIIEVRDGKYRGKAVTDPLVPFESIIKPSTGERSRLSMGYIGFLSYEATDRKSTRLNSSHVSESGMPSSA